jgi:hypothetical protein
MVIAKKVRRQTARQRSWLIRGLDENPLVSKKRKRKMKLILLHTCAEHELFSLNPELVMEIGNDVESQDSHRPEDEVRVLQSRISGPHEILLYLASRPFKIGDRISFTGLTRVHQLNGQVMTIRRTSSPQVAGFQLTLGPDFPTDPSGQLGLVIHNYSVTYTVLPLAAETGFVFKPEHRIKCGFVACCSGSGDDGGGKKIDTKEDMNEILEILKNAGIADIFDPEGHTYIPPETDKP